jgi:predicted AAA+ superfamily ATPase
MKIIHCMNALPRLVSGALAERLAVMPAVVVTGARQTGKSTLAEQLVQGKRLYRTLDDFDVLEMPRGVIRRRWWEVTSRSHSTRCSASQVCSAP